VGMVALFHFTGKLSAPSVPRPGFSHSFSASYARLQSDGPQHAVRQDMTAGGPGGTNRRAFECVPENSRDQESRVSRQFVVASSANVLTQIGEYEAGVGREFTPHRDASECLQYCSGGEP